MNRLRVCSKINRVNLHFQTLSVEGGAGRQLPQRQRGAPRDLNRFRVTLTRFRVDPGHPNPQRRGVIQQRVVGQQPVLFKNRNPVFAGQFGTASEGKPPRRLRIPQFTLVIIRSTRGFGRRLQVHNHLCEFGDSVVELFNLVPPPPRRIRHVECHLAGTGTVKRGDPVVQFVQRLLVNADKVGDELLKEVALLLANLDHVAKERVLPNTRHHLCCTTRSGDPRIPRQRVHHRRQILAPQDLFRPQVRRWGNHCAVNHGKRVEDLLQVRPSPPRIRHRQRTAVQPPRTPNPLNIRRD